MICKSVEQDLLAPGCWKNGGEKELEADFFHFRCLQEVHSGMCVLVLCQCLISQ